ncbi:hypothetical protein CA223_05365 [Sphingomonas koreensis]|uniref:Uncharacterized protein n=1 Tax=Sphingomonas koreensis TaxID=93064 RepID=A0A1L6JBR5_9SPHN|nr:hypothetical protein [Sphingomonas koreensis]APR53345.1 hypothetical protein BRX40_13720 [Sphingomonas koreensis]MDC7809963.1 hypothetical protein [Sphingomonas koreensis]RSU24535.1 hypothetical protein CA224_02115 [Sphingomonas koreensis]RSU25180.1 hypothetical protein CA222_13710 [Sphingomonas koreensis]RSU30145.1 hypothetical protein CA225_05640 [Sphingomonas koreensis]
MDIEERVRELEEITKALHDELVAVRQRAFFAHVIAGMAAFTLTRVLPWLVTAKIIGDDILTELHSILLRLERNEQHHPDDRASARKWRETLGREG